MSAVDEVGPSGDVVPEVDDNALRLGELLLRNCKRVSRLGSYIGLFEWVLFAYLFSVRVAIHLAANVIDPMRHLLPGLVPLHNERVSAAGDKETMHVAWCKVAAGGKLELSRDRAHEVNHFVLLVRITAVDAGVPAMEFPDGGDLHVWAENNGFMVVKTICQGDCGVDCMAAYLGMPRRPAAWLDIRLQLTAFARSVCGRPTWLAGFRMAGEQNDNLEGVVVSRASNRNILRSRCRAGSTFARWLSKPHKFIPEPKKGDGVPDDAIVKKEHPVVKKESSNDVNEGDDVPAIVKGGLSNDSANRDCVPVVVKKESSNDIESGDGVPVVAEVPGKVFEEDELLKALLWSLGGKRDHDGMPWQVNIWRREIGEEECKAMIEAYRMKDDKIQSQGCKPSAVREKRWYKSSLLSYRMAMGKHIDDFLNTEEAKRKIHKNNKWVIVCEHFGILRHDKNMGSAKEMDDAITPRVEET